MNAARPAPQTASSIVATTSAPLPPQSRNDPPTKTRAAPTPRYAAPISFFLLRLLCLFATHFSAFFAPSVLFCGSSLWLHPVGRLRIRQRLLQLRILAARRVQQVSHADRLARVCRQERRMQRDVPDVSTGHVETRQFARVEV